VDWQSGRRGIWKKNASLSHPCLFSRFASGPPLSGLNYAVLGERVCSGRANKHTCSNGAGALGGAGTLPSDLSKFQKLTSLVLTSNIVGGPIPSKMPPNLVELALGYNRFAGNNCQPASHCFSRLPQRPEPPDIMV
jgi:hypothetical protein